MLALLISFFLSSVYACVFSPEISKVYSLSGTVSLALRDLKLLREPQLKGVSIFHPIDKKDFRGEFLPGGVFLSPDSMAKINDGILFYDESRELTRMLARSPKIKAIEVKTRGLTPMEVASKTEELLKPFVKGCDLKVLSTDLKVKLETLKKTISTSKSMLFFLGAARGDKWPSLLMVNDGVVRWMVSQKLITTYPSELAYVNWSAKIMNSFSKDSIKVGLVDPGSEIKTQIETTDQFINLTYPGSLIPGTGQVDAMIYLFKNLP